MGEQGYDVSPAVVLLKVGLACTSGRESAPYSRLLRQGCKRRHQTRNLSLSTWAATVLGAARLPLATS